MTSITLTPEQLADIISQAVRRVVSEQDSKAPRARQRKTLDQMSKPVQSWNAAVKEHLSQMVAEYRTDNGLDDMPESEIKSLAKSGKIPPFPIYKDAMVSLSELRRQSDPEQTIKYKNYLVKREQIKSGRRERSGKSDTSSVVSKVSDTTASKIQWLSEPEGPDDFCGTIFIKGTKYAINHLNHLATIPPDDSDPEWVGIYNTASDTIIECDQPE